ncbi:hypothetical protein EMIT0P176_350040 [Pseudomonas sp. IT-P176]
MAYNRGVEYRWQNPGALPQEPYAVDDQSKSQSGERVLGQFDNAWIQALAGNMTWRF